MQIANSIDPHFCNSNKHITPIARFIPTKEGLSLALKLVESVTGQTSTLWR